MKIDIRRFSELQNEGFLVRQDLIGNELCWLVQPQHIGVKFTQENKFFRSSMWNSQGELISASFPKFVNLGENNEHFPDPTPAQLKKAKFLEKLDGSTLIVSWYNDQYIIRTRGTFDARVLNNGWEIDNFLEAPKYQDLFSLTKLSDISLIFEWITPNNKIVLQYDQPELRLIGGIHHETYELFSQSLLDEFVRGSGVDRPIQYNFPNMTLMEIAEEIKTWQNQEGVCVYYMTNNGWEIKKIKSAEYLRLHAFKSEMSPEKLIEIFVKERFDGYQQARAYIISNFDYESFQYVQGWVSQICDMLVDVQGFVTGALNFIRKNNLASISRKDAAEMIKSAYGNSGRAGILFTLLDGKEISDQQYKTLLLQFLNVD